MFLSLFAIAVLALLVYLLWNLIVPDVTGFKPIKYLEALGLMVLTRLLFGGLGNVSEAFSPKNGVGAGMAPGCPWARGVRNKSSYYWSHGERLGRWRDNSDDDLDEEGDDGP
jgi:hypothetical protein